MSFAQRLERCARLIDARLEALLEGPWRKGDHLDQAPDRLRAAMTHAALGGGKRFRPFLVLETAALFGLGPGPAVEAACALELIHCYSLAHDDLPSMDNDPVRRGRPSVWKAFDDWTAILAGDALQTLAFERLADPATHPDPAVRIELVSVLARASGAAGMAGGQALDLAAEKRPGSAPLSAAEVRHLQGMKTGALMVAACEMGAILGRASPDERERLLAYGEALGLAFQIADDLLDAEGDASVVGKAVAKDSAAGKATLVSLLGLDTARAELANAEQRAIAALAPFGSRASHLKAAARFVVNREH
jgi:farnesyl diphosphate synthase